MIRKNRYIWIVLFSYSCNNLPKDGIKAQEVKQRYIDTIVWYESINDTTMPRYDTIYTGVKLVDTFKLYAKLIINAYSLDSVIATVSFVNNESKDTFFLYKPLLPNQDLKENTFPMFDSAGMTLKFNAQKSYHEYVAGSQNFLPAVVPVIDKDNIIELKPHQTMEFKINLSNYFYFKGLVKDGKHCFFMSYSCLMPYIKGGRQLTMFDQKSGKDRLLYISVNSKKDDFSDDRRKVCLPRSS